MGGRRDPQWVNIPLPTMVTAQRSSTRQERLVREQKKKEEDEKFKKRRKEEEQMAKILAQRWAEEDMRKTGQVVEDRKPREKDRERRRRREDRDEELPADVTRSAGDDSGENQNGEAEGPEKPRTEGGGWQSFSPPRPVKEPINLGPVGDKTEESKTKQRNQKIAGVFLQDQPPAKKQKVAGIFGLSDSDDEKDVARREMEMAAQKKSSLQNAKIAIPAPQAAGGSSSASSSTGALSAAGASDVQMRLSQWKLKCKGKWVEMPPDLRRDVDRLMGNYRS